MEEFRRVRLCALRLQKHPEASTNVESYAMSRPMSLPPTSVSRKSRP